MFGLTKKQQREMLADQFFYFWEQAGEPFQATISGRQHAGNHVGGGGRPRGDARRGRRIVLAFYGYLPNDEGNLLNVDHHANVFKRVHSEGPEHLAAWTLHTNMRWERKGNWSPYVRLGPNAD